MAQGEADVRHFDLKQMERFRDGEVQPVHEAAKRHHTKGVEGVRPLGHLLDGHITAENLDQKQQILHIGKMVIEDLVSGPKLIEDVRTAAEALDKLLGDQVDLFKELMAALTETIEKAAETKENNLDAIDAQTLLQTLEDVDALLTGAPDDTPRT
ncbi:type VII secretion system-associated protein [Streptomyces spongiicola]|uniref:Type VII secretion system-associated protein n=1 Tax=Streptomyces spongiicola TaxID=1690221 RepID=A0A388T259_9ACTN|nr:type VII secretion system-associated protein [Streptomyces spongiicola]GBQ02222.1 type VII secretion system-associated protein [Streptomyces spongiicola]